MDAQMFSFDHNGATISIIIKRFDAFADALFTHMTFAMSILNIILTVISVVGVIIITFVVAHSVTAIARLLSDEFWTDDFMNIRKDEVTDFMNIKKAEATDFINVMADRVKKGAQMFYFDPIGATISIIIKMPKMLEARVVAVVDAVAEAGDTMLACFAVSIIVKMLGALVGALVDAVFPSRSFIAELIASIEIPSSMIAGKRSFEQCIAESRSSHDRTPHRIFVAVLTTILTIRIVVWVIIAVKFVVARYKRDHAAIERGQQAETK